MFLVFLIMIMSIVGAQLAKGRSVHGFNQERDHVFSYHSPPDRVTSPAGRQACGLPTRNGIEDT